MSPRVLAGLLLLFVGIAAWQVTRIPASPMYAEVGATLVPAVVTGLLGLLAVSYGVSAARGAAPDAIGEPGQEPLPGSSRRLAYFVSGCLAFSLLVEPLGFWLAGTLGGMGVARSFDEPIGVRAVIVCAAIALAFWLLFAVVLGIDLGSFVPGLSPAKA